MPDPMNQGLLADPQPMAPAPQQGVAPAPGVAPASPGGQPAAAPAPAPRRDYQQQPLNEQDAQELEMFVISAQKLIHSPQSRDQILGRIGVGQKGPIDDISDTALLVVDRVESQLAKDLGKPVDDFVKLQGANSVVGDLIAVAEASKKVPKLSEDEKAVAYAHAVQKYTDRMIQRGEITREELQKYAQEAVKIGQQSGALNTDKMKQALPEGQVAATPDPTMAAPASSPAPMGAAPQPVNPIHPPETMAQKLAKGGLLNG